MADDLARSLRSATPARLRIGRAGSAMTTGALLAFELDHARARDAVHEAFDASGLAEALGRDVIEVRSQAASRADYLTDPDLGRRLDPASRLPPGRADLAIIIADGLSARAVHAHAASLALDILGRLDGWTVAPVVAAHQARVALGDAIGAALGADLACVLIGERPGLTAPDSLGAYLTWAPEPGRRDHERNCVSNIRPPDGLSYAEAADTICRLLRRARKRRATGVALKDGLASLPDSADA
jgi:ethanolamine ammonia-lyase small subunit